MSEKRRNIVELPAGRIIGPLENRIRKIAAETSRVLLSDHAADRMWARGIDDSEVFEVLRLGGIRGLPWFEENKTEPACKMVFRRRGAREIGVVTIVLVDERLLVKTVEWEDER